jgi:hypothetical protein
VQSINNLHTVFFKSRAIILKRDNEKNGHLEKANRRRR